MIQKQKAGSVIVSKLRMSGAAPPFPHTSSTLLTVH